MIEYVQKVSYELGIGSNILQTKLAILTELYNHAWFPQAMAAKRQQLGFTYEDKGDLWEYPSNKKVLIKGVDGLKRQISSKELRRSASQSWGKQTIEKVKTQNTKTRGNWKIFC